MPPKKTIDKNTSILKPLHSRKMQGHINNKKHILEKFVDKASSFFIRSYNDISFDELKYFICEYYILIDIYLPNIFKCDDDDKVIFEPNKKMMHSKHALLAIIQNVSNSLCNDEHVIHSIINVDESWFDTIDKKTNDIDVFGNIIEKLVIPSIIKCPKCNSLINTKMNALDGSFVCSNDKCTIGKLHYCKLDDIVKAGLQIDCCSKFCF